MRPIWQRLRPKIIRRVSGGHLIAILIIIYFILIVTGASPADLLKIREAINNATSLQEVERLTGILQSGNIPEEFLTGGSSELFMTQPLLLVNVFQFVHGIFPDGNHNDNNNGMDTS